MAFRSTTPASTKLFGIDIAGTISSAIAGAGGLGSPASIYLAVAGVGHIRLCDFDSPDLSNLNRQICFFPYNFCTL
jgi:tRNA A37 threonylcarbamoyladenosine dehydratase